MALRDILVCLDPTDAGEHRLRLAAAIAREHQAHLSAAYVMTEEIAGAAPYGDLGIAAPAGAAGLAEGSLVAGMPAPQIPPAPNADTTRGAALADIIEQRYRETVRPNDIDGDWHLFGSGEAADLVTLVKTVDLVVYGRLPRAERVPAGGHHHRLRPADAGCAICRQFRRDRPAGADRLGRDTRSHPRAARCGAAARQGRGGDGRDRAGA